MLPHCPALSFCSSVTEKKLTVQRCLAVSYTHLTLPTKRIV